MTAPPREDERCARFRTLYEENYERILGYALRRVQRADALDVVAETFTVAWRKLARIPDGDEARLWLYGTARGVLANHERGARRRARLHGRLVQERQRLLRRIRGRALLRRRSRASDRPSAKFSRWLRGRVSTHASSRA